jgi:hypothetical protein
VATVCLLVICVSISETFDQLNSFFFSGTQSPQYGTTYLYIWEAPSQLFRHNVLRQIFTKSKDTEKKSLYSSPSLMYYDIHICVCVCVLKHKLNFHVVSVKLLCSICCALLTGCKPSIRTSILGNFNSGEMADANSIFIHTTSHRHTTWKCKSLKDTFVVPAHNISSTQYMFLYRTGAEAFAKAFFSSIIEIFLFSFEFLVCKEV